MINFEKNGNENGHRAMYVYSFSALNFIEKIAQPILLLPLTSTIAFNVTCIYDLQSFIERLKKEIDIRHLKELVMQNNEELLEFFTVTVTIHCNRKKLGTILLCLRSVEGQRKMKEAPKLRIPFVIWRLILNYLA